MWLDNAVFYEIYPQSFCDTNADGIGDFQGIIDKLPYIRELGCNAIWMNPCFDSPFGDAGYDISDYYKAAPRYGTNADLKRLFDKAHELGMHILLDLVPGHTSVRHPWFRESMKARRNPYTDRYVWTNNIWERLEGMNCLHGVSEREGSCVVNFFSHQPALNYGFYKPDPAKPWQQSMDDEGPRATLEALKDIMRFWLKLGADGFRVDMAGSLVKNDEDGKGNIALWRNVRAFLDQEFPDAAMVSEWGEPDKSLLGGFHMDFLLHFGPSHYNDLFRCDEPYFSSRGKGDKSAFLATYQANYAKTEGRGLICIPSGNHDMDRMARRLSPDEMKLAFAFLLTMPGAPFIYYGDEIGMRHVENLTSVEGGYQRTGARSPMQWDDTCNAGFSAAAPDMLYIPIDPNEDRPTARAQMNDPASLRAEVQRLIALRMAHPALQSNGSIAFVGDSEQQYPLCYVREAAQEKLLVVINPSAEAQTLACDMTLGAAVYARGGEVSAANGALAVPGCSAGVYVVA